MATANKIHHRAHCIVYRAIRSGKLDHPYYLPCSKCGCGPSEYHHPDYTRPLRVVALCRWCHRKEHKKQCQ